MYIFAKKMYKSVYILIRYLESITQAYISAYFGLDSRECECLEYLEYYFRNSLGAMLRLKKTFDFFIEFIIFC
jgi:hypothetical protein